MVRETLTPEVVMDAAALAEIRTPAVAVAGVLDRLRASSKPLECVIVGAGVQGWRMRARLWTCLRGAGGGGDVCIERQTGGSAVPVG